MSKYIYQHVTVASLGDNPGRDWLELLGMLNDGSWEIISVVSDGHKLHYILRTKS